MKPCFHFVQFIIMCINELTKYTSARAFSSLFRLRYMMDVDTNRSSQWINYATETGYICLSCQKLVCNKSRQCSVSANEYTPGWKAGISVAYYVVCSGSVTANNTASIFINKADKRGTFSKVHPKRKISSAPHTTTKRKCLTLSEKVDVIKTAHCESIGTRKFA